MVKKNHLIDDSGVHSNAKTIQSAIFIGICHTLILVLAILGLLALLQGFR